MWTFYDKDPKFKKDPTKKKQYPAAICKRCKTRVPRTLASTKGMNQHLENRHIKCWKLIMEAKLKASKAKVCPWLLALAHAHDIPLDDWMKFPFLCMYFQQLWMLPDFF